MKLAEMATGHGPFKSHVCLHLTSVVSDVQSRTFKVDGVEGALELRCLRCT